MWSVLTLLSGSLSSGLGNLICPPMSCSPPSDLNWDVVCGQLSSNGTYYFNSEVCSGDYTCTFTSTAVSSRCIQNVDPAPQLVAYPGEVCDNLHGCVSGTCAKGRCMPPEVCENYYDCDGAFYCENKQCVPLGVEGAGCTQNWQCLQNATCNTPQPGQPGTCMYYLSAPAGTALQACDEAGNVPALIFGTNSACQSNTCVTQGPGIYTCTNAMTSTASLPVVCSDDCSSSPNSITNVPKHIQCQCGYNANGTAFCPLFSGDEPAQKLISLWRNWLSSSDILACNTYSRLSTWSWCMQSTYKDYDQLQYQVLYVYNYPQYVQAQDCYLKIIDPTYYELAMKEVAEWLVAGAVLLIV